MSAGIPSCDPAAGFIPLSAQLADLFRSEGAAGLTLNQLLSAPQTADPTDSSS